jgi:hypothetical protein
MSGGPLFFPSPEDRAALQEQRTKIGLAAFSPGDRERYHAYDYGWRRVVLNDFAKTSPIDPEGDVPGQGSWFRQQRVEQTEAMWRRHFDDASKYSRRRPAFEPPANAKPDQVERWEYEQRELAKLRPAAEAEEAAGVGNGPAAIAYVGLIVRFIHENIERWGASNQRVRNAIVDPSSAETVARLQRELGLRSREELRDMTETTGETRDRASA